MKKIDKKVLITTCIICLLPIILGIAVYDELPNKVAIHWGISNQANGFASKEFTIFGLPILMVILQIICCITSDLRIGEESKNIKFVKVMKWLIPVLTVILYGITIAINLGNNIDIRIMVMLLLGIIFIITGNYIPKIPYGTSVNFIHPKPKDEKTFRKMTRYMGYSFIIIGITFIISILLSPIYSAIAVVLAILIIIISTLYTWKSEE